MELECQKEMLLKFFHAMENPLKQKLMILQEHSASDLKHHYVIQVVTI